MRNSLDVVQLEATICRFSFKEMKTPNSLRFRRLSGFQAIAEMLNAFRILWEALVPVVLLWWNAILCACCARYYTWNRSRFRLDWEGNQVTRSDVKEVQQGLFAHYESGSASYAGMKELAYNNTSLCTQTSSDQAMEGGCLPGQRELPLRATEGDGMYADDICANDIAMDIEGQHDDKDREYETEVCISSCVIGSKSAEATAQSDARELSSFHRMDGNIAHQLLFLKDACPCLIPTEVAPHAIYDLFHCPNRLLEYLWMRLSLHSKRNFMDGRALIQALEGICIEWPGLEEHLLVSLMIFVLSAFDSKNQAYLAKQAFRYLMNKASVVNLHMMRLASSLCCDDLYLTRTAISFKTLTKPVDNLSFDLVKHPSSASFPNFKLKNYLCQVLDGNSRDLDNEEEDVFDNGHSICKNFSQSYDGHDCNDVSDFEPNGDLIQEQHAPRVSESRQTAAVNTYSMSATCSYFDGELSINGKEMRCSDEISILDSKSNECLDKSTDWDVNCGHLQLLEEDGVSAGYYNTHGDTVRDYTYFQTSLDSDGTGCNGSKRHNGDRVCNAWLQPMKTDLLAETWWDEDAVLVGEQEQEVDIMDQSWQVV